MSIYLWEGKSIVASDMKWPCDDGFHVPLKTEWDWLQTIMTWLSLTTWDNRKLKLHMPYSWSRDFNANVENKDQRGRYWSSSIATYQYAYYIDLVSWDVSVAQRWKSYACCIRPFKDEFVVPASWWTVIQGTLWSAWIFWNQTDGIISITSDWTTWYTIADKNLWATTVYNSWDTLSQANMWCYYQWGNNYWFTDWVLPKPTTWAMVDASTYWPWNYYSSDVFITWNYYNWDKPVNNNLWWWVSQWTYVENIEPNIKEIYLWEGTTIVVSDMKWPCTDGFHVPLSTEWQAIYDAWVSLGAWTSSWGQNFSTYLKLPFAGSRNANTSVVHVDYKGYYWSSSSNAWNAKYQEYYLSFLWSSITPQDFWYPSYGYSIRWFKDTPVIPTSSWTKLYGTSIESWWIFYNSTDWLISISSNGTTWYTIMDKNLWATTVYNFWDTPTEANCGNVFQRWNNHAFPWTLSSETLTTSNASVDTTWYWPWNYYESSTWITASPRQSSANDYWYNLRWWVSQWSSTIVNPWIKAVYVWDTKVRSLPFEYIRPNVDVLYSWSGWTIKHWYDSSYWEILLQDSNNNSIIIADRDYGSSWFWLEWTLVTYYTAVWLSKTWYKMPTKNDMKNLMDIYCAILWKTITYNSYYYAYIIDWYQDILDNLWMKLKYKYAGSTISAWCYWDYNTEGDPCCLRLNYPDWKTSVVMNKSGSIVSGAECRLRFFKDE